MPIAALSGLAGGVTSLLSTLIGSSMQYKGAMATNRMNLKIARENNEAMLSAMREQTRADQEYNSIGSQMQRAMAAGVNPMLLAGAQPTSVSAAGVPNLDSPVMQNPFDEFGSLGANLGSSMMQALNLELQGKQLDIADFKSKVDMLKTLGDVAGGLDWTSDELKTVLRSVFQDSFDAESIGQFMRDDLVKTRIRNQVETSNLDLSSKKYLYGWLDEMTNAQFTNLLADTEVKQTQSKVNRSIDSMNEAKKREIEQAISNMREQWKSLNFQGELDAHKLLKVANLSEAIVKEIVSNAEIAEDDAQAWLWYQIKDLITVHNNSRK